MEEPGVFPVKGRKDKNVMVTNGNETIPKEYVLRQSASLASLNKARSLSHDLYGSLENGYSDTLNTSEDISQRCFLCQTNDQSGDLFRCNWCRRVSVCSNHHFRVYHRVRSRCWPFHLAPMRKDSPPGKFHLRLTATRDIKKGEIIFIEASTLATPQPHSFPTCPVCLRRLRADAFTKCNSCSIPLCGSLVCANSSVHQIECRVLTENKINLSSLVNNFTQPHFIYSVIILLRMCALEEHSKAAELFSARTKKSNDDQPKGGAQHRPRDMVQSEELLLREFVFQLPDHVEKRRGLGEWKMFQKDVVDFLRRRCFMANEKSDEQLHKLLGIFMAHSTTIDSRVILSGTNEGEKHLVQGRLLFPVFALMNHSCLSSTIFTLEADPKKVGVFNVVVRARRNVAKGEELSVSYVSSILGNHKRRRKIQSEWYFQCKCLRCSDPTEFHTYVSALKCEACESGLMLPSDCLNMYSKWICSDCDFELTVDVVEAKIDRIEDELSELSIKDDLKRLEQFIEHYSGTILHENHYLILLAKRNHCFITRKARISELSHSSTHSTDSPASSSRSITPNADIYRSISGVIQQLQCQGGS